MGQICEDGNCVVPPCDPVCGEGETCGPTTRTCMCGAGAACADGQACCGGSCIDVQANTANCGTCGNVCGAGLVCLEGGCTDDVPCAPACRAGETCAGGFCRCGSGPPCTGTRLCCGGSCVDISSDVVHCGACGRACGGTDACCSGVCINTRTNFDNCGGCGRACDGDVADGCSAGSCTCRGESECRGPSCQCIPPMPPVTFGGCTGLCL
ncbi:MAG: hypothetical protein H6722_05565 [Sandaracinus sp.]|nr:hypothetical protein [Sandaracinus sp.]